MSLSEFSRRRFCRKSRSPPKMTFITAELNLAAINVRRSKIFDKNAYTFDCKGTKNEIRSQSATKNYSSPSLKPKGAAEGD